MVRPDDLDHWRALARQARHDPGALDRLEAALALAEAESSPPEIGLDPMGYITSWNLAAEELFGYRASEAIGQHVLVLYAETHADPGAPLAEQGAPGLPGEDDGKALMEVSRRKKSGEVFRARMRLVPRYDTQGDVVGMRARFEPLEPSLNREEKLRLYLRIIEDSTHGVMITDANERIVVVNSAFTRITGYSAGEAIGQTPELLRAGRHDASFHEQVRRAMRGEYSWSGELLGRRKNGEVFPQSVSVSAVHDDQGRITHAFSIFSDISAHKAAEAQLHRLANFDSVTGLPNRSLLLQLGAQALSRVQRHRSHGALLVLQLQRMDLLHDTLGHDACDTLLLEISQGLRGVLREEDVLARGDSDKFAIGLFNIHKREHAAIVAQKLLDTLDRNFIVDGNQLRLSASIGIAVFPEDGLDTAHLLRCAELAASRARGTQDEAFASLFYSAEMNQRANAHLRIESELRQAIAHGQLCLHYQPKASLRNGRIAGAEALIRWQHPTHGLLSPARFVPVAEETRLIQELGEWVLDEACRQMRAWTDAGAHMPPIAINLSARQVDARLPGRIEHALNHHRIHPSQLRLEITESLVMRDAEQVLPILNTLVAMGLSIALDDFGTGYSSLAYLKRFPISTIKIDRAFVEGLPHEANDRAIAQAIVTMGKQLRQEIVAEGVETHEQMAFLRGLGCDQLQGYLFSPPLTAEAFERWVGEDRRLDLRD